MGAELAEKTRWITYAKIEASSARGALIALFWLWGILGLIINGLNLLTLSGSVGVGTSTYIAAGELIWIGGMILFGLGAAIIPPNYEFKRPELSE